jgi:hypothetical protein
LQLIVDVIVQVCLLFFHLESRWKRTRFALLCFALPSLINSC